MHWIKEYLLCVTAAAILCAIIKAIIGNKGTLSTMVKLLTGLFLAITAISPWAKLDNFDISSFTTDYSWDVREAVAQGEQMASESVRSIIKEETEAYILDKAAYLELSITVDVTVSEGDLPAPSAVTITGNASPYAKRVLTQYIQEELAIPEENQIWT